MIGGLTILDTDKVEILSSVPELAFTEASLRKKTGPEPGGQETLQRQIT